MIKDFIAPALDTPELAAARIGAALEGVDIGPFGAMVLSSVALTTFMVYGMTKDSISEFLLAQWNEIESHIAQAKALLAVAPASSAIN